MRVAEDKPKTIEWLADEEPGRVPGAGRQRGYAPWRAICHIPQHAHVPAGMDHQNRVKAARKVLLDLGLLEMVGPPPRATSGRSTAWRRASVTARHYQSCRQCTEERRRSS